jgi:hypothetical protein
MGGCPLPSLARPSLLHRLNRKDSKIFVHPLGTRLDVCNGYTRSLSVCHLRWWTNANEPRRICKTLYKSDAAPCLEQHIDVTRRIVGDESLTCRQHRDGWQVFFQGRVYQPRLQPMHSGRPPLRPCTVPAKTSFSPRHTHASMTAVNVSITRTPRVCLRGSPPVTRLQNNGRRAVRRVGMRPHENEVSGCAGRQPCTALQKATRKAGAAGCVSIVEPRATHNSTFATTPAVRCSNSVKADCNLPRGKFRMLVL